MYQMRTRKPSSGNKFFITRGKGGYSYCIQGYPTDRECDVLSNCVGYACGRFNEIIGSMKYPYLNCNAEDFIDRARSLGLKISNKPVRGGIMVWRNGRTHNGYDGAGHVAIVEKVIDSNRIYTSESNYGNTAFYNATRTNNNGQWGVGRNYIFMGCIINPYVDNNPDPTPTPKQKYQIGEKVIITGPIYTNSNADTPVNRVNGIVTKITRYNGGSKHPYNTTGDLGWIDTGSITIYKEPTPKPTPSTKFKVGDKVVPIKLVDYDGTILVKYDDYYEITEIYNDRVVLGARRNGKLVVWAAVNIHNIKLV